MAEGTSAVLCSVLKQENAKTQLKSLGKNVIFPIRIQRTFQGWFHFILIVPITKIISGQIINRELIDLFSPAKTL